LLAEQNEDDAIRTDLLKLVRAWLAAASEPLTRSSVFKVTGTRDEAIALTQDRIRNWQKRRKLKARAIT
jgi:hypothetical protein